MSSSPAHLDTNGASIDNHIGEDAGAAADATVNTSSGAENGIFSSEDAAVNSERVVVKFLIPNAAAGSIIGRAGANITEIQTESKARMQLSKSNEFYPGTHDGQDRILLISGTIDQLLTALHLVLVKLKAEPTALKAVLAKDNESIQLRMLVHSRLCGTLIGKGGATVRSFTEDSKAAINISPPPVVPGLTERIVKMTGDVDGLMRAVALLVTKLSENPDYHLLTDANLTYSTRFSGSYGYDRHAAVPIAHATTVTVAIPEDKVGRLIGKQGVVINQMKDLLGINIKISKKGEHLPGTNDRACHISGAPDAVEIAQRLVQQKIDAAPVPRGGEMRPRMR